VSASFELLGAATGNCLRVAIALEEAGLSYTSRSIDLRAGEHHSDNFRKLNPACKVPVLIERNESQPDFVLAQSNAIMLHVARRGPGSLLPDPETAEYAIALERFFYVVTDVIAPNHASFFLRSEQDRSAAAALEQKSMAALEFIERYLTDTPFIAGSTFTLADICAFTMVSRNQTKLGWRRLPNLKRWFDKVSDRPGVLRGCRAF
jgi:GSH-dependent disulfide-bond oxidoreductase